MATTLAVQVSIPNVNNLPADVMTNTWHFRTFTVDPVDGAVAAHVQLLGFYQDVAAIFSHSADGPFTVKSYDLADSTPRVPILTSTISMDPAGAGLPNEVACVLSYAAPPVSGMANGRRRGRIFLGPLASSVMDDSSGQSIIQGTTLTLITEAASAVIALGGGAAEAQWSVFSPTTAGAPPWSAGEITAATFAVTHGFVDNAFDTVRSRGVAATSRQTFD